MHLKYYSNFLVYKCSKYNYIINWQKLYVTVTDLHFKFATLGKVHTEILLTHAIHCNHLQDIHVFWPGRLLISIYTHMLSAVRLHAVYKRNRIQCVNEYMTIK